MNSLTSRSPVLNIISHFTGVVRINYDRRVQFLEIMPVLIDFFLE